MTYQPLISVIISTHNRHALFQRAVKSILAQTYPNLKLIIIDNVSNPPVKNLDVLQDARILVYRTESYLGASASRNLGIELAVGEFICFLDDDDYYCPHKLEFQVTFLKNNPHVDMVYSDIRQLDRRGREICLQGGPFSIKDLLLYRYISINGFLAKRQVLVEQKFDENMTTYEDQQLFFRIGLNYHIRYIPGVVGVWNRDRRPDQASNRNIRRSYSNWKRLCLEFEDTIIKHKRVRRYYFGKMLLLSLINGDILFCIKSLRKYA